MRFTSIISLVLLPAFAAVGDCRLSRERNPSASVMQPHSPRSVHAKRDSSVVYKDMLLSRIDTHSFRDDSGTPKREATFSWSDPNSNTSTTCTTSWLDSTNSTSYPTSYIFCEKTSRPETWQWYFSSYISGSNFTLQLAHQFEDPAQFAPPYDIPIFFSTTGVNLKCVRRHGLERCSLPRDEKVVHAAIDGISD